MRLFVIVECGKASGVRVNDIEGNREYPKNNIIKTELMYRERMQITVDGFVKEQVRMSAMDQRSEREQLEISQN